VGKWLARSSHPQDARQAHAMDHHANERCNHRRAPASFSSTLLNYYTRNPNQKVRTPKKAQQWDDVLTFPCTNRHHRRVAGSGGRRGAGGQGSKSEGSWDSKRERRASFILSVCLLPPTPNVTLPPCPTQHDTLSGRDHAKGESEGREEKQMKGEGFHLATSTPTIYWSEQ
jgi:hypothetical protein